MNVPFLLTSATCYTYTHEYYRVFMPGFFAIFCNLISFTCSPRYRLRKVQSEHAPSVLSPISVLANRHVCGVLALQCNE